MDLFVAYAWPIVQMFLLIAAGLALLTFAGIAKEYINSKTTKDSTFAWNAVLNYSGVAVTAVAQMFKVRPEGLTDEEWNAQRFDKANELVQAFALTLGFTLTDEFLLSIAGAIEAAVKRFKPENTPKGLLQGSTPIWGGVSSVPLSTAVDNQPNSLYT